MFPPKKKEEIAGKILHINIIHHLLIQWALLSVYFILGTIPTINNGQEGMGYEIRPEIWLEIYAHY